MFMSTYKNIYFATESFILVYVYQISVTLEQVSPIYYNSYLNYFEYENLYT